MSTETQDRTSAVVAKALALVGDIATLPEVTIKIIEVVENPEGTAADLHNVIKKDPALSARVLKVVNSAFYGLPGQVASVDRAIVLLGLSAVKNIAIGATLSRMFKNAQKDEAFDARELWTHSVAVAVAARKVAVAAGEPAGHDEIFLAGLIHDLGLLIERQVFAKELCAVVEQSRAAGGQFLALEQQIIGASHQEIGAGLTSKWRFPRHIQGAVGFHHAPESLSGDLRRFGMIVHCADVLCCQEQIGFPLTAVDEEFTEELLGGIGITVEQLVGVRDDMGPELDEAQALLGGQ